MNSHVRLLHNRHTIYFIFVSYQTPCHLSLQSPNQYSSQSILFLSNMIRIINHKLSKSLYLALWFFNHQEGRLAGLKTTFVAN